MALGRSGNLAIAVFSVEVAVAVVLAAMYFFIAACSGLKERGFSFGLPELALPETSDKVAVAVSVSVEPSSPMVLFPEISPPSLEELKAAIALEFGKLEFCGLLLTGEATEAAKFGRDTNVLIAVCLGIEDGREISAPRSRISSNKPLLTDEFNKLNSELERLNLLTSNGTLSISAAIAVSSADSPSSEVGLLEVATFSSSMLNCSGFTDTCQIKNPPAQRTASGVQTAGCIQWPKRAMK